MDISYLLWLQELRNAWGPGIENFFVVISNIGASSFLVMIPLILFWSVDKTSGSYVLAAFSGGQLINQLIKSTACVYRTWIRDARVIPAKGAIAGATGYSFPSGHTVMSSSIIGLVGWIYRAKCRLLQVLCWVFVALVMFSRNFLDVHTPQDVLVGLCVGVFVCWAFGRMRDYVEENPGKDMRLFMIAMFVNLAALIYFLVKPYPMDYVDGKLLVDPVKMNGDSLQAIGMFLGFVLSWFLERKFVRFSTKGLSVKTRVIRSILGVVFVGLMIVVTKKIFANTGVYVSHFIGGFVPSFFGVYVVPYVFVKGHLE